MKQTSPDVFARTMPLIVERHYFGEHKNASLANVDVRKNTPDEADADKRLLSMKKRLIESPETQAVHQCDNRFRDYLKSVATPFRPGFWLVPVGLVEPLHARAKQWQAEREVLVDAATAAYPMRVAAMGARLGPLYNTLDYPPPPVFRAAFWIDWRFVDFGVPNLLREINAEVFAEERGKVQAQAAKARELIEQHAAATLLEITDHLEGLLQPKGGGKFPQLRTGALDKLRAFLDTAAMRDVTDFKDMQAVTRRLGQMMAGVTVEGLRDDDALRERLGRGMAAAKETVAKLVTDDARRGIRLRAEEVA